MPTPDTRNATSETLRRIRTELENLLDNLPPEEEGYSKLLLQGMLRVFNDRLNQGGSEPLREIPFLDCKPGANGSGKNSISNLATDWPDGAKVFRDPDDDVVTVVID
jgi:hypothetical protein